MGEAGALRVWFGAMLLTCIVCFGQVLVAQEKPNTVENRTYRIAPGDVLQIDVWKQSEITRTIPVLPDGTIYLPLVNGVKVAGLTAMQLAGLLREKLLPFVDNPQVTVTVVRMRGTPPTTLPARPILPQRAPQMDTPPAKCCVASKVASESPPTRMQIRVVCATNQAQDSPRRRYYCRT